MADNKDWHTEYDKQQAAWWKRWREQQAEAEKQRQQVNDELDKKVEESMLRDGWLVGPDAEEKAKQLGIQLPPPNIELTNDPERAYLLNNAARQGHELEARIAFSLIDSRCPFCDLIHGRLGVESKYYNSPAMPYKDLFAHFRLSHYQPPKENQAEIKQIVERYMLIELKQLLPILWLDPARHGEHMTVRNKIELLEDGTIFKGRDKKQISQSEYQYEAELTQNLAEKIEKSVKQYKLRESPVRDKAQEFMNKVYAMLQQCVIWETNDPYSVNCWECFGDYSWGPKKYKEEWQHKTLLKKQARRNDNKDKRNKRRVAAYQIHKQFLLDDRIIARMFGRRDNPDLITKSVFEGMMIEHKNKVENLPKWMHIMMGLDKPQ